MTVIISLKRWSLKGNTSVFCEVEIQFYNDCYPKFVLVPRPITATPGFDSTRILLWSVLYKVAPRHIFLPVGLIFPVSIIPTLLFTRSHPNAATVRQANRGTRCNIREVMPSHTVHHEGSDTLSHCAPSHKWCPLTQCNIREVMPSHTVHHQRSDALSHCAPSQKWCPLTLCNITEVIPSHTVHHYRSDALSHCAPSQKWCPLNISGGTEQKITFVFNFFGFQRIKWKLRFSALYVISPSCINSTWHHWVWELGLNV